MLDCDILIDGAVILTMDRNWTLHECGHLAIKGENIIGIGSESGSEARARWNPARTIDAKGRLAMPGFVNTHTHVPMRAFRGLGEDVPDRLRRYIFPLEKRAVTKELVRVASEFCIADMLRSGTTCFADMYYFEQEVALAAKRLGARALAGETVVDFPAPDCTAAFGGIEVAEKLIAEWKGDSTITPCYAPHAPYTVPADVVAKLAESARKSGVPVLMHIAETIEERDQNAARGTTTLRALDAAGCLGPWLIAAHMIHVDEDDIRLAARRDMAVAHCPASNAKSGRPTAPALELVTAGVRLGLGTDGPLSGNGMDMQGIMGLYPKLQKVRTGRREVVSARDAVRAATIGGAEALGLGDRTGTLEKGKAADLVLARMRSYSMMPAHDWYSTVAYSMRPEDITDVFVAGRQVRSETGLTTVDEAELFDSMDRLVKKLKDEAREIC